MKKRLLLFGIVMMFFTGHSQTNNICIQDQNHQCIKEFPSVFQMQNFIDTTIILQHAKITDILPFSSLNTQLLHACSQKSINQTQIFLRNFEKIRLKDLGSKSATIIDQRYQILQRILLGIDQNDTEGYCKQRGIILGLLNLTQSYYFNTYDKQSINITKAPSPLKPTTTLTGLSIGNYDTDPREHMSPNQKISQTVGSKLFTQQTTGISPKDYMLNMILDVDHLSAQDINFANTAHAILQTEIANMYQQKMLTQKDIEYLNNKIHVLFHHTCGNLYGSFNLLRKLDNNGENLRGIYLNIKICDEESYLNTTVLHIRQLLVHELGHYFYFFKDQNKESFDTMCWQQTQQVHCKEGDFVSAYAQTKKEEDYAETFSYRYMGYEEILEKALSPSNIRTAKYRYFDDNIKAILTKESPLIPNETSSL